MRRLGIVIAALVLVTAPAWAGCEDDLAATSEYAALLRAQRDSQEQQLSVLKARVRVLEQDKQTAEARLKALEDKAKEKK